MGAETGSSAARDLGCGVAGRAPPARGWGVTAFLAAHRRELFSEELFADLFATQRGRPSIPADVIASVIVLQALHELSDDAAADLRRCPATVG